jgi:nicotinate-nucleotide adenylyltransferase
MIGSRLPPGLRIGVLGGSFNPAHEGHRAISLAALKALKLDYVVWLVSPHNPLKAEASLANYDKRLAYAREEARHPRILVSDFEARGGFTYTIDTLRALKRRHPRARLVLLLGADNLAELARWRRWSDLFKLVPIAVFARPGYDYAALASKPAGRYRAFRRREAAAPTLATAKPPAWVYIARTHRTESATAIRATGDWPAPR